MGERGFVVRQTNQLWVLPGVLCAVPECTPVHGCRVRRACPELGCMGCWKTDATGVHER